MENSIPKKNDITLPKVGTPLFVKEQFNATNARHKRFVGILPTIDAMRDKDSR